MVLLDTKMFNEGQTHPRHVSDHKKGDDREYDKWDAGDGEGPYGFVEPNAGNKEIQGNRRCEVADFKIGKEYDTEVDGINSIVHGNGNDDGHDDHEGRVDIHEATHVQKKQVQGNQESFFGVDVRLDNLKQLHGDLGVDHKRGHGHGRSDDYEDSPDKDHALPDDCGQLPDGDVAVDKNLYDEGI